MNTWNRSRRSALSSLEAKAARVAAPRGVRHPEQLDPSRAALADRALQRIVDVMEEEVHSKRAKAVLSAAIEIREEICGPKVQKISLEGSLEQILVASLAAPSPQDPELPSASASGMTPPLALETREPSASPLEEIPEDL